MIKKILSLVLIFLCGCQSSKLPELPEGVSLPPKKEAYYKSTARGDKRPSLKNRPKHLIPGFIPEKVRYRFCPDKDIIAAETKLRQLLDSTNHAFTEKVIINPGAWVHLNDLEDIGGKNCFPTQNVRTVGGSNFRLIGMVLKDKTELSVLHEYLSVLLRSNGGFKIRAFTTDEMVKWWAYNGADITEPTLVVETNNWKYKFIFCFTNGKVICIDELNSLPNFINN